MKGIFFDEKDVCEQSSVSFDLDIKGLRYIKVLAEGTLNVKSGDSDKHIFLRLNDLTDKYNSVIVIDYDDKKMDHRTNGFCVGRSIHNKSTQFCLEYAISLLGNKRMGQGVLVVQVDEGDAPQTPISFVSWASLSDNAVITKLSLDCEFGQTFTGNMRLLLS